MRACACDLTRACQGCPEPIQWKQGKLLGKGSYGSVHMGMKGDGTLLAVKRLDLSSDKVKSAACVAGADDGIKTPTRKRE